MSQSPIKIRGSVFLQAPYYSVQIGNLLLRVLCDGITIMEMDKAMLNIEPERLKSILSHSYLKNAVYGSINTWLLEIEGKVILIDSGSGELLGPDSGHVLKSLASIGYSAEDIDVVLLTHIHSDHSGGISNGDIMVFPNAFIYVSKHDVDFWLNEENKLTAASIHHGNFDYARLKLNPYLLAGRLKTFDGPQLLFPGLSALPSPGHTPGHTHFVLEDGGDKLVICGDLAHVPAVQFADPSTSVIWDIDPDKAASARKHTLTDAARHGYWLASSHASFPGVGHVRPNGNGFDWVPLQYSVDGAGQ